MQKVIIQNEAVNAVIDKDVQACVQQIFAKVVGLNNFDKIADDIAKSMIVALTEKSFMTTDLELTDKQKEALSEGMSDLVKKSVQTYVAGIAGWCSILLVIVIIALFWGVALYSAMCVLFGAEF